MAKVVLTSRQLGGGIVVALGVLLLLSGAVINPWVNDALAGAVAVDRADVYGSYWRWSWGLGALGVWLGRRVGRAGARSGLDGLALLFVVVATTIALDRFLLTRMGLTLWEHDPELHYRHRPGAVRSLVAARRPRDRIVINAWGHHDTEFPQNKPADELRGLMLGDSVVMGYALTYEETSSARLEALLSARDDRYATHQIINAGVHGYATHQERVVFERSVVFEPDFVVLGVCLNDVTEPYVVDESLGGTGLDYHGVRQTPSALWGWLSNETGFGRLTQKLSRRRQSRQELRRLEQYNVRDMAQKSRTDPRYREAWDIMLRQLEEVYALAEREDLPLLILVFPYTLQLADESLRAPQEILAEHAQVHGVDFIDTTPALAQAVFDDPALLQWLREHDYDADSITALHRNVIAKYFVDYGHLTREGNVVVAEQVYGWLQRRGLVD